MRTATCMDLEALAVLVGSGGAGSARRGGQVPDPTCAAIARNWHQVWHLYPWSATSWVDGGPPPLSNVITYHGNPTKSRNEH